MPAFRGALESGEGLGAGGHPAAVGILLVVPEMPSEAWCHGRWKMNLPSYTPKHGPVM